MSYTQYYGGAIWTNHALSRLGQRGLTQEIAWQAFQHPDRSVKGRKTGTMQYEKQVGNSLVSIVAKQNEKREWIIISCWVDPPLPGSIDIGKQEAYKQYHRSSFWGKFFLTIKQQLGL